MFQREGERLPAYTGSREGPAGMMVPGIISEPVGRIDTGGAEKGSGVSVAPGWAIVQNVCNIT